MQESFTIFCLRAMLRTSSEGYLLCTIHWLKSSSIYASWLFPEVYSADYRPWKHTLAESCERLPSSSLSVVTASCCSLKIMFFSASRLPGWLPPLYVCNNVHSHIYIMYIHTYTQCTFTHIHHVHSHIYTMHTYTQCKFTHIHNVHAHIYNVHSHIYTMYK